MRIKNFLLKNLSFKLWACILIVIVIFIVGYKLGEEVTMRRVLDNTSEAADEVMRQFNDDIDALIDDFNY